MGGECGTNTSAAVSFHPSLQSHSISIKHSQHTVNAQDFSLTPLAQNGSELGHFLYPLILDACPVASTQFNILI